jgi:RNA polymerase sigma factor (sigma-70 family)
VHPTSTAPQVVEGGTSVPEVREDERCASSAQCARLVAACRQDRPGGWDALVRHHSPWMRAVARRQGLDDDTAEDAVQYAWLNLFLCLPSLRSDEAVAGWLATTVRREAIRLSKKMKREPRSFPPDPSPDVDESLLIEERRLEIRAACDDLRPHEQELLWLLFSDDETSYEKISMIVDRPIGSIGPTRQRLLHRLATTLSSIAPGS